MDVAKVRAALNATSFVFGDKDPVARQVLKDRIETKARRQGMIYYSDLVEGVTFRIPSVNSGKPYMIDTSEWTGLDRRWVTSSATYQPNPS